MARSTKAEKARQINTARGLLQRGVALSEAVRRLSREFDLSERQAYRYLEEASQLDRPVEVTEPTVPITLKLPPSTVERLRKYARSSGLKIGRASCRERESDSVMGDALTKRKERRE